MSPISSHPASPAVLKTLGNGGEYEHHEHRRTRTNTAEIDNTISHPGSVKINVEGAFIVDRDSTSPNRSGVDGANHETTDIRLPNHTAVVSHIAVDVRYPPWCVARLSSDCVADWRISSQTRILLARTATSEARRTPELYELRDRQD